MAYTRINDAISGEARPDAVKRDADGAIIPADPGNTDWQAYRAWLDAGNAPAEPAPPDADGGEDVERPDPSRP